MKNAFLIFIVSLFIFSSCSAIDITRVQRLEPLAIPVEATPAPVYLADIVYDVPVGTTTLGISTRSLRCPLKFNATEKKFPAGPLDIKNLSRSFQRELEVLGYGVTDKSAPYKITARITNVKMDVCKEKQVLLGQSLGYIGESQMDVEWSVSGKIQNDILYKTTSQGYAELHVPNDEGLQLLFQDSFAAAAHNLGADPEFFRLVFGGHKIQ